MQKIVCSLLLKNKFGDFAYSNTVGFLRNGRKRGRSID